MQLCPQAVQEPVTRLALAARKPGNLAGCSGAGWLHPAPSPSHVSAALSSSGQPVLAGLWSPTGCVHRGLRVGFLPRLGAGLSARPLFCVLCPGWA